jgi:RND family efflux transporter MFP subunit
LAETAKPPRFSEPEMNRHLQLAVFASIAVLFAAVPACQKQAPVTKTAEAPVVTVSPPTIKAVIDYRDYTVRELGAEESVDIRARVSGYLEQINFKPGQEVKIGDVLFVIDQRPFKADLDRAISDVKLYEARLIRATADLQRAKQLIDSNSIPKEDYDKYVATESETKAALEGAKAAREQAQNNLDFATIKAPVNGRISRELIGKGNLVRADDTLLTTIVDSSYIYAYFDMDEPTLLRLIRERIDDAKKGQVDANYIAEQDKSKLSGDLSSVVVSMRVGNDTDFAYTGHLDFVDNQINLSTGTIPIRAKFDNPAQAGNMRKLVVGGHGDIRVPISDEYQAMLVPDAAIQFDQSRQVLYTVNDKDVVVTKPVKTGELHGDMRVILEGIQPTDRVIVEGFMRVRTGATVKPENAEQPPEQKSAAATKPADAAKPEPAKPAESGK